jgi:hypothetical protein
MEEEEIGRKERNPNRTLPEVVRAADRNKNAKEIN